MFRQHQVAHVMGGMIKDSNNESVVRINVAPDTWVTRTALRRGKKLWDQHIQQGTEGTDLTQIKPKYHDYKVYLNNVMGTAVLPRDAAGNTIPGGEWTYSSYHSEDVDWNNIVQDPPGSGNRQADTFQAAICGAHSGTSGNWTRIGLITSWFDSRATPRTDEPFVEADVSSDPLVNLFDEADTVDEIIDSLRSDNDGPPYDVDNHFGNNHATGAQNNLQRVAMAATQTGAGQIASLNGFTAICGLVEVHITQGVGTGEVEMILDVMTKGGKI